MLQRLVAASLLLSLLAAPIVAAAPAADCDGIAGRVRCIVEDADPVGLAWEGIGAGVGITCAAWVLTFGTECTLADYIHKP